jgi:hypothetical protein
MYDLKLRFKVQGSRFNIEGVKLGLRLRFKTNVFKDMILKDFINLVILQILYQNIVDIASLISK